MSGKSAKRVRKSISQSLVTKQPRTKQEINQEYSTLASQIGAATVQIKGLEFNIEAMLNQVNELGKEMQAREQLDKQSAPVVATVAAEQASV